MPGAYDRAQRDRLAQSRGYENYQDYRRHGFGRIAPGVEPTPQQRRAYSGHAGLQPLVDALTRSRNRPIEVAPRGLERGAGGRWRTILVDVTFPGGNHQVYYLRGRAASQASLRALRQLLEAPGSSRARAEALASGSSAGGGVEVPSVGGGDEEPEDEEDYDRGIRDYDYYDDYDDLDYEPIPFIEANSIDVFAG